MNEEDLFRLYLVKEKKNKTHAKRGTHTVDEHLSRLRTLQKDPLGRKQLTVNERITQGRKALEDLGFTVLESQEVDNKIRYTVVDE